MTNVSLRASAPFAASVFFGVASSALAQPRLWVAEYEFNNPIVKSMNLDGSGVAVEFTPPAGEWLPVGLEIDAAAGKVLWLDQASPHNLFRANLDGSARVSLTTPGLTPRGPAVDSLGRIYFKSDQQIRRINPDGSGLATIYSTTGTGGAGSGIAGGPCVDAVNGHLYVGANGTIIRMNLDGTNVRTVVSKVSRATEIKLDIASNWIYFADATNNSDYIGRARLDGTGFEVIFDNGTQAQGTSGLSDLEVHNGFVYFCDELTDIIRRVPQDGGTPTLIYAAAPTARTPYGLALSTGPTPQAVLDLNRNGISDTTDIANGTPDCNLNGIPDDAERSFAGKPVCTPPELLFDAGENIAGLRLAIGAGSAAAWEQYQPITVPAAGWDVGFIGLAAQTIERNATGARLAIYSPDNNGNPDRANPIASTSIQFKYSYGGDPWEYFPLRATLAPGRYFVGLTAFNNATYFGEIASGLTGEPRVFNGASGVWRTGSTPLALRVVAEPCRADLNGDNTADLVDFFEFFQCYDLQQRCADIDGTPGTDLADFFAFFESFDVGC